MQAYNVENQSYIIYSGDNCEELGPFVAQLLKLHKGGGTIALIHVQQPTLQFRNLKWIIYWNLVLYFIDLWLII